jgi:hypothetical protein
LRRASQNDLKEQIVLLLPPGRHSHNVFADKSILAVEVKLFYSDHNDGAAVKDAARKGHQAM